VASSEKHLPGEVAVSRSTESKNAHTRAGRVVSLSTGIAYGFTDAVSPPPTRETRSKTDIFAGCLVELRGYLLGYEVADFAGLAERICTERCSDCRVEHTCCIESGRWRSMGDTSGLYVIDIALLLPSSPICTTLAARSQKSCQADAGIPVDPLRPFDPSQCMK